jgi:hypothetical protein
MWSKASTQDKLLDCVACYDNSTQQAALHTTMEEKIVKKEKRKKIHQG